MQFSYIHSVCGVCVCWHNSKDLVQCSLVYSVCAHVSKAALWALGGIIAIKEDGGNLPFLNKSVGHVTSGSHRGHGQSETRG